MVVKNRFGLAARVLLGRLSRVRDGKSSSALRWNLRKKSKGLWSVRVVINSTDVQVVKRGKRKGGKKEKETDEPTRLSMAWIKDQKSQAGWILAASQRLLPTATPFLQSALSRVVCILFWKASGNQAKQATHSSLYLASADT